MKLPFKEIIQYKISPLFHLSRHRDLNNLPVVDKRVQEQQLLQLSYPKTMSNRLEFQRLRECHFKQILILLILLLKTIVEIQWHPVSLMKRKAQLARTEKLNLFIKEESLHNLIILSNLSTCLQFKMPVSQKSKLTLLIRCKEKRLNRYT